jgi:methylated-DNA-[protein]-cysteine S-methyltransferase
MPIVIPCHRVVGADMKLNGYLNGLDTKAFLLRLEGHQVEGDRLVVRI